MERGDVPVIQTREKPRFALEPGKPLGIFGELGREYFDGDIAPELGVARTVDLAHATGTEQRFDFVLS